jgi:organic hydroperoxide reductase OsmC/OhrA
MISYPIVFKTNARAPSGIQTTWIEESQSIKTLCSIPQEFEGPGGGLSPEDLFAQALSGCFLATFKVYAEKSRIEFDHISVQGELTVDLDESKKPIMKKFILNAEISGCSNLDRARSLAEKAFSSGFILNSVKTELSLNLSVS